MSRISEGFFVQTLRAIITAIISMLISILVFSAVVHFASLSSTVIKAVNQFLKVMSVFIGCFFCLHSGAGFIKGLLSGVGFALLTSVIFAFIGGEKVFSVAGIVEILFCGIIGLISGIISVNVKGR